MTYPQIILPTLEALYRLGKSICDPIQCPKAYAPLSNAFSRSFSCLADSFLGRPSGRLAFFFSCFFVSACQRSTERFVTSRISATSFGVFPCASNARPRALRSANCSLVPFRLMRSLWHISRHLFFKTQQMIFTCLDPTQFITLENEHLHQLSSLKQLAVWREAFEIQSC